MKRRRITKKIVTSTTKVSLSHLKAFRPFKRTFTQAKARYELSLRKEITLMFKDLSYNSMLNEKRDLRQSDLNVRQGVESIYEYKVSKFIPTSYTWMKDPVLGIVKTGCNFVDRTISKMEVLPTIRWAD